MSWLPQNYEVPSSDSNYLKFKKGATQFRIMSEPIMGHLYWNMENKPVRSRMDNYPTGVQIKPEKDGSAGRVKHFWACVVWNYDMKKLQILELTQATIQRAIQELVESSHYGDPQGYDIVVKRLDDNGKVTYNVMPLPPKARPIEAVTAIKKARINLDALYTGGDPFAGGAPVIKDVDVNFDEVFAHAE